MNVYHVKDEAGKVSVALVEAETPEEAIASVKASLEGDEAKLELEAKVLGTLPHKTPAPPETKPEVDADKIETKPEHA